MLPSCLPILSCQSPTFRAVPRPAARRFAPSCPLTRSGAEGAPRPGHRQPHSARPRSSALAAPSPARSRPHSEQATLAPGTAQPWSREFHARGDRFTSVAKNTRGKKSCVSGRFTFLFSLCSLLPSNCLRTAPHPRAAPGQAAPAARSSPPPALPSLRRRPHLGAGGERPSARGPWGGPPVSKAQPADTGLRAGPKSDAASLP